MGFKSPPSHQSISIHALREEGDGVGHLYYAAVGIFLSTPSARRATAVAPVAVVAPAEFLSTPSARRATRRPSVLCRSGNISIHALREEGDKTVRRPPGQTVNFYPRPPRGGRRERPAE